LSFKGHSRLEHHGCAANEAKTERLIDDSGFAKATLSLIVEKLLDPSFSPNLEKSLQMSK